MALIRPLTQSGNPGLTMGHLDFQPRLLGGCQYWGEADGPNLFSGSNVSRLSDMSGNSAHANQGTAANQPVYLPNLSLFNNRPALDFQGNDELVFSGGALDMFRNRSGYTVFLVLKADTIPASLGFLLFASVGTSATTARFGAHLNNTPNYRAIVRRLDADSGVTMSGGTPNTALPFVYEVVLDHTNATPSLLVVNGTVVFQSSSLYPSGLSSNTASQTMFLGSSGGANYFDGQLGGALVFKRALNPLERKYVRSALGKKYGIAVN